MAVCQTDYICSLYCQLRFNLIDRNYLGKCSCFCELTVSQERGFGSNHLVFLKARPQHAMGRWESRILGYTRYNTRAATREGGAALRTGGSLRLPALCYQQKREPMMDQPFRMIARAGVLQEALFRAGHRARARPKRPPQPTA